MDQNRFESSAKQWPVSPFQSVISLSVDTVNMSHYLANVSFWLFNQQMVMVTQKAVCMYDTIKALTSFAECI